MKHSCCPGSSSYSVAVRSLERHRGTALIPTARTLSNRFPLEDSRHASIVPTSIIFPISINPSATINRELRHHLSLRHQLLRPASICTAPLPAHKLCSAPLSAPASIAPLTLPPLPRILTVQRNDVGSQYRSGIYYHTEEQKEEATASMKEEEAQLKTPIAIEILPATSYYLAEDYHQQYLEKGASGRKQSAAKMCNDPIRCYG